MDNKGFQTAWKKGAIKHKRSYQAEESFKSEWKKWLGEIDLKLRGVEEITV